MPPALFRQLPSDTIPQRPKRPTKTGRRPTQPISKNTILFALYRMGYHSRMTAHGFRAIASTTLNELGYRPDVIERQLAHTEKNAVRAAYHRSQYLEERKAMMQQWADHLDALREVCGKAVAIGRGRQAADLIPIRLETKTQAQFQPAEFTLRRPDLFTAIPTVVISEEG